MAGRIGVDVDRATAEALFDIAHATATARNYTQRGCCY